MSQAFRLPAGGRIDRSRRIGFRFNGRRLHGYEGDTLASALLANGIRLVGRSFKLHRPRGVMSAGEEECNALLDVDFGDGRIPTVRATLARLTDGLEARSQNCFPSVAFDLGRTFDRLWPAGFYNKMFKWPNWPVFEGAIRRASGLGRAPNREGRTRYRHRNAHCDVLVVGAGPSGLARALTEVREGRDVILVEQDFEAGGSLLHDRSEFDGQDSDEWLKGTIDELGRFENIRLMLEATAVGYYDHNVLTIHDRSMAGTDGGVETLWKVRAGHVVLATGAIEQPLLFGNNDLPGVMSAGAMHQYLGRFGVRCADNTVGVANNDLAWSSLFSLHDGGVGVLAIADTRLEIRHDLLRGASERGIAVHPGSRPVSAYGSRGVSRFAFLDASGKKRSIRCRSVAVSGGLSPTVHLFSQAGGRLRYDPERACFVPDGCRQAAEAIGAAAGDFAKPSEYNISPASVAPCSGSRQWVDYQYDVLVSDIELAVRENYGSVEHMKRYTTAGMSVDQGKTSTLNALSVLASLTGRDPGELGTTTYRPLYMPVTMGAIAGNRRGPMYLPSRRLPAHAWHESRGAVFDDYGPWKRPAYYGGYSDHPIDAIFGEVEAVRNSVGLFDGSPLGKFEIVGPDAAEFLNRIYLNTVSTLKVGKVRYGLMLNENGTIIDDGVCIRMADDRFLVNSTSAGADRMAVWLERWRQCEWPDLELVISPVSSQWGVATVAGPRSRDVLANIDGIGDLSSENFPHMSFRKGILGDGTPFRLQRVGFSGEQSYELSVPAGSVAGFLEQLSAAGEPYGIRPFGIESLDVLRLEKGFLHVGGDTDATTNPLDVGFSAIVANKKADFIGKRSLLRPHERKPGRRQLVGIVTSDPLAVLNQGAHVVRTEGASRRSEGFVTSSAISPTLGRRIALGMIENGTGRMGEDIQLYDLGKLIPARIGATCAYDPGGERMRA